MGFALSKRLAGTLMLLILAAAGCGRPAATAPAGPPAQGDAGRGAGARETAFETNANKVYLPVRLNGAGPFWFILDSGAAFDVLDSGRARALGLALAEGEEVRGAGQSSVDVAVASDVKLSLAGVEFAAPRVNVIPIGDWIASFEGRSVDGLLGHDFFQRFVVEIDYAAGRVRLHDPHAHRYAGRGESIPLEIERGHAYVKAALTAPNGERHEGRFLVDTGFRLGLVLAVPYVEERGLRRAFPAARRATPVVGLGGESPADVARAAGLQLGSYRLASPVVTLSRAERGVLSGRGFAGILGADVLRRFKIFFDYPGRRMIVEPAANYAEPFGYDQSGLLLRADARGLSVHRVMEGSPASEAGLRESDVVEAVDGRPAASYTLEQFRRMFMGPEGSTHEFRVNRNGLPLKATLKLRRMI